MWCSVARVRCPRSLPELAHRPAGLLPELVWPVWPVALARTPACWPCCLLALLPAGPVACAAVARAGSVARACCPRVLPARVARAGCPRGLYMSPPRAASAPNPYPSFQPTPRYAYEIQPYTGALVFGVPALTECARPAPGGQSRWGAARCAIGLRAAHRSACCVAASGIIARHGLLHARCLNRCGGLVAAD